MVYMPLRKLPVEAIVAAKHVLITYTFVDNLPLTKIYKFLDFAQLFCDILADYCT